MNMTEWTTRSHDEPGGSAVDLHARCERAGDGGTDPLGHVTRHEHAHVGNKVKTISGRGAGGWGDTTRLG